MSNMTLDAVQAADRAVWEPLWRDYLAFYETTLPGPAYDTAFAQLVSDDPGSFDGLIARRDGRAVGLVHWVWHPHMWRPAGTIYLQDLFTVPAARGMGVGRALIRAVYAAADARGAPAVYWLTQADNPARALYDTVATRTGFVKYQR